METSTSTQASILDKIFISLFISLFLFLSVETTPLHPITHFGINTLEPTVLLLKFLSSLIRLPLARTFVL